MSSRSVLKYLELASTCYVQERSASRLLESVSCSCRSLSVASMPLSIAEVSGDCDSNLILR